MDSMTYIEALKILNLDMPYTSEQLKVAYRKASKENHPDLGGSSDKFIKVQNAYEVLKPLVDKVPQNSFVSDSTDKEYWKYDNTFSYNSSKDNSPKVEIHNISDLLFGRYKTNIFIKNVFIGRVNLGLYLFGKKVSSKLYFIKTDETIGASFVFNPVRCKTKKPWRYLCAILPFMFKLKIEHVSDVGGLCTYKCISSSILITCCGTFESFDPIYMKYSNKSLIFDLWW